VKTNLKITGLASVFMLWGCASVLDEDGALTTVPYDIIEDGGFVIGARVNGQGPFTFTLDSAASISVIFDELSSELELEPVPGNMIMIHGLVTSGEFPLLSVDRLSVASEVWDDPSIAALPGKAARRTGIDGILGVDFLRRYAVGFSNQDQVLRLYPPDLLDQRSYWGWMSIPLELMYIGGTQTALYYFEIEVGGLRMPAVFDLGAGLNMMNWAAARAGAIESTPVVARIRTKEITTGDIRWQNEDFIIADLEIFTALMHEATPCAILGAGLFTQRDFIIDFARNRLLVKTAMQEAADPGAGSQ